MPEQARASLSIAIVASKDLRLNTRVVRQAKSLLGAGHRVAIVGFRAPAVAANDGTDGFELVETGAPLSHWIRLAKIRALHWLPFSRNLERDAELAVDDGQTRSRVFARRIMPRLAGARFDVIQAHFDKSLAAADLLARSRSAKLIFDAVEYPFDHELVPREPLARAMRLAEIQRERVIAENADAWITVNESLADLAVERFGICRPFVLPNYPEAGRYPSDGRLRRDLGLRDGSRILLHLNTMRAGEGLETIIDALAQLPQDFHAVGLGPIPERGFEKHLRRRAAGHGVGHRFHIAPLQHPAAVIPYIAAADIGVIAREGTLQNFRLSLPNRVFQLIAARLPLIATPIPEIANIIRTWQAGLTFQQSDPKELAAAVREMSETSRLAEFRIAVERAAANLVWEPAGQRYVKFIERVFEAGRAGATPCIGNHAALDSVQPF